MAEVTKVDRQAVSITGDSGRIVFAISTDAGAQPDGDFIWLRCSCECTVGPFNVRFPFEMTGHDVRSMYAALDELSRGIVPKVRLDNLEEDFWLTLEMTKTGSVIVEGRISPRVADYAALEFQFRLDLQTVTSAAAALKRLYTVIPSNGLSE